MMKHKNIQSYCVFLLLIVANFANSHAFAQGTLDIIVDSEVIIRLDDGFDIEDFNAQFNTTTLRSIVALNTHLLQLPGNHGGEDAWLEEVRRQSPSGFIWGEVNYEGQDGEGRTGSFYVSSIGARGAYGGQYSRNQQNLPLVHEKTTGSGTLVAVLDTGIDSTHELLRSRIQFGGYNYVDLNNNTMEIKNGNDDDGDGSFDEAYGHGTFVGGLIIMMAPDAKILPVKVLNSDGHGNNFFFAQGIHHAIDRGADVINMSLGSTYDSLAVKDAVREAAHRGIVIIGAAGNQNMELREFPGLFDRPLGITSLDENDIKSPFSSFHRKINMSAPGSGGIFSSVPLTDEGHTFAEWEGTSFSTAIVSGAAALILAAHPDWPENVARAKAVQTCMELTAVNIDSQNSQYAGMLGEGRLDVAAALNCNLPQTTWLFDYEVMLGTVLPDNAGDIPDIEEMEESDDEYVGIKSGFGNTFAELHKSEVIVQAGTLDPAGSTMNIAIESRVNEPAGIARILLKNWDTDQFEQVHQYAVPLNDSLVQFQVNDAGIYIGENGNIEMLIKHLIFVPQFAFQFQSYFDLVQLSITN